MASYTKINAFTEAMAEKKHNLGADTLKVALTNTAHTSTWSQLSELTEVSYSNLSDRTITVSSSSQTGGTYKLVCADLTLTSSGGTTGPFRYVYVYNDTATNDDLICYFDYGSSMTLQDSDQFIVNFDGTNGLLTNA